MAFITAPDIGRIDPDAGKRIIGRIAFLRSAIVASGASQILDARLGLMRSMPIRAAIRSAFLVDAP